MTIAGLEVASAAVAQLALLLHKAGHLTLAEHVGRAVDTNRRSFRFGYHELPIVLSVLQPPPDSLAELRVALLQVQVGRTRDGLS
jgi:hypothetical protein